VRTSLRRLIYFLLLGVLTFALASACSRTMNQSATSSKPLTENCRVVQHRMGETCIPLNPQRVVALWMGTFSSSLALGVKPVATLWSPVEPFPAHLQDKVDDVEIVANADWQPNLERILRLKPDLILSTTRWQNINAQLASIAPTVVIDQPAPPPPWQEHLEAVAKVLNKEQESKQLIDDYWRRVEQLKQALGDRRHQIQVSVITVNPPYGIFTSGKKHPTGAVLNDIGLKRPPAQSGDFFTMSNISYERLSVIDGDVLFLAYRGGEPAKEALAKLQQNPLWQKLKVVQQNRVYFVDSAHWYAFDILAMNAVIDDLYKYLVNTPHTGSKQ
jgi:iron complex transport system substrate-binding protein